MTPPYPADVAELLRRAVSACRRATREGDRARRARESAATGPEQLRRIRLEISQMHDRNERLHSASAMAHLALAERLLRLNGPSPAERWRALIDATAESLSVPSVAAVLLGSDHATAAVMATDDRASSAQDLELVYGEGPLRDAALQGTTIAASRADITDRWPTYGSMLADIGVTSLVATPLRVGPSILGILGLYDPPEQKALDSVALVAELCADLMVTDPPPVPGDGATLGLDDPWGLVQRAAGVVAADLGTDLQTAISLIRARAFAQGETSWDTAARITRGQLHLSL